MEQDSHSIVVPPVSELLVSELLDEVGQGLINHRCWDAQRHPRGWLLLLLLRVSEAPEACIDNILEGGGACFKMIYRDASCAALALSFSIDARDNGEAFATSADGPSMTTMLQVQY